MEIKNVDLRIDNYITDETGGIFKVYGIHRNGVSFDDPKTGIEFKWTEDLRGIPLTEELLLKMGFSAIGTSGNTEYFSLDEWDIDFYEGEWHVNLAAQSLISIKYVHQLQNLYHALTGQELTLS